MLEHTAKDGLERINVRYISHFVQSVKLIVCTIPLQNASPDYVSAADVVVRSNDRPEIAELLYYF